jgi:hypothetical protein
VYSRLAYLIRVNVNCILSTGKEIHSRLAKPSAAYEEMKLKMHVWCLFLASGRKQDDVEPYRCIDLVKSTGFGSAGCDLRWSEINVNPVAGVNSRMLIRMS